MLPLLSIFEVERLDRLPEVVLVNLRRRISAVDPIPPDLPRNPFRRARNRPLRPFSMVFRGKVQSCRSRPASPNSSSSNLILVTIVEARSKQLLVIPVRSRIRPDHRSRENGVYDFC
jgi:hypothetical protein